MTDASPTVLIVDDEPDILEMVGLLLESEGYRTMKADGGQAALDVVARESVDLILLDIMMPELDGHEVLDRLRTDAPDGGPLVVMLTARNDLEAIARSLKSGADGFVAKPFDLDSLLELVAARLRGGPGPFYRSMEEGDDALAEELEHSEHQRLIFLHLLEPDYDHSVVAHACDECQHRLLSLWQEPHGVDRARTTALMWLESPEDLGRMINRILNQTAVQVQDCMVYRHWADIPMDVMQGGRS
jgi:DNA-binding response OmpR family regulator